MDLDFQLAFRPFSNVVKLNDPKGFFMTPCSSILQLCDQRYNQDQVNLDATPPVYIYLVMMENSRHYTITGRLGDLFRQILRSHLQHYEAGADMSRMVNVALAVQSEVMIRRDTLYPTSGHTENTEQTLYAEKAILENLKPVVNSRQWEIEFSFPDFRPRVSLIGSLEVLSSTFDIIS